jgi:serine/threonine protein kinase
MQINFGYVLYPDLPHIHTFKVQTQTSHGSVTNTYRHIRSIFLPNQAKQLHVYKKNGNEYVISKFFKNELEENVKIETSILNDIRTLGGHINIAELVESTLKVHPMLITEYCNQKNLLQIIMEKIHNRIYFTNTEIKNIFRQIMNGMHVVHALGYAHRDISPDNIMLHRESDGSEMFKLIDFELAVELPRSEDGTFPVDVHGDVYIQNDGRFVGKPSYISPEFYACFQARNFYCPLKCDIWGLGIILYFLLTLKLPWQRAIHSCSVGSKDDFNFGKFDYFCANQNIGIIAIIELDYNNNNFVPLNEMQDLIDLLNNMLNLNVSRRLNTTDILNHYSLIVEEFE